MTQSLEQQVQAISLEAMQALFPEQNMTIDQITINETKSDFNGDYTLVLFPFLKLLKTNPNELGNKIGEYVTANYSNIISAFEVVAGFLNFTIQDATLVSFLSKNNTVNPEALKNNNQKILIEYSSPNTNKPLHFGHLRNIFLGWSMSEILKATGNDVIKANLVNDRGIHICKSMIAWMQTADGATPQSTNTKGDKFVGDYYVKYNDLFKAEVAELVKQGQTQEEAEKNAPIFKSAQELLLKWEQGDESIYKLWETMNGWVYEGFNVTYEEMGIDFDKYYYESNTYLLGKELVQQGLEKGILFKKDDGSVWIDLTDDGLDQKLLLRADGTSVYMTQDLGTAKLKYDDYQMDTSIYVIADEQNYHMQVLKLIMKKMGYDYADGIFHLSYGMVELPTGRMKSREGTVVDADDMIAEMIAMSKAQTEEAGKTEGFTEEQLMVLYKTIGLGALKFYLLRVDPKKKMVFNPEESIDLHGFTATFIQYVYARIQSVFRKTNVELKPLNTAVSLSELEKNLVLQLEQYPAIVKKSADNYNPSELCNYAFKIAQAYNSFYDKHSIANAESEDLQQLRLQLSGLTADTIKHAMQLLGIAVPNKM